MYQHSEVLYLFTGRIMGKIVLIMVSLVSVTLAQRPGYAGSMPFGYPVMVTTTTTTQAPPPGATGGLGNRYVLGRVNLYEMIPYYTA